MARVFPDPLQIQKARHSDINQQRLASLDWKGLKKICKDGTYGAFLAEQSQETDSGFIQEWNPAFLATKANADVVRAMETPTLDVKSEFSCQATRS